MPVFNTFVYYTISKRRGEKKITDLRETKWDKGSKNYMQTSISWESSNCPFKDIASGCAYFKREWQEVERSGEC